MHIMIMFMVREVTLAYYSGDYFSQHVSPVGYLPGPGPIFCIIIALFGKGFTQYIYLPIVETGDLRRIGSPRESCKFTCMGGAVGFSLTS